MPRARDRGLVVVGSAASLRRAEDLVAAHAELRPVRTVTSRRGGTAWRSSLADAAAVILVADPAAPVAEVVEGTHVDAGGRAVPVGVLPDDPRAFGAAATVQRRAAREARLNPGPFVLLSSHEDRVRDRALRMATVLEGAEAPFRDLPTGRIDRSSLLAVLAAGPGLAIYTGEGDARGWRGYGRVQSWELDQLGSRSDARPIGALVSLSCSGSARLGSLHGLCESVVAHGAAASALGAVDEVRSEDDDRLGELLAERLESGAADLAQAFPEPVPELALFRISGDPLAPFIGARGSRAGVRRLDAPAAGDRLEPVDWT